MDQGAKGERDRTVGRAAMIPKYPQIKVKLTGTPKRQLSVIIKVRQALWAAGLPNPTITEFICQATLFNDFPHLLRTCQEWEEVE